jgi:HSP20 family molecular chaperone IbpA
MNPFQIFNYVTQYLERSFFNSVNGCQQSTLWISHTEETAIAAIKIYEMGANFILKVRISDIHLVKLKLQVTPETVLIQGQPTASIRVEGDLPPRGFESLIPLPHPVQPETCWAEIQPDGLTVQLTKHFRVEQSGVWLQLPAANSINQFEMTDCRFQTLDFPDSSLS